MLLLRQGYSQEFGARSWATLQLAGRDRSKLAEGLLCCKGGLSPACCQEGAIHTRKAEEHGVRAPAECARVRDEDV